MVTSEDVVVRRILFIIEVYLTKVGKNLWPLVKLGVTSGQKFVPTDYRYATKLETSYYRGRDL